MVGGGEMGEGERGGRWERRGRSILKWCGREWNSTVHQGFSYNINRFFVCFFISFLISLSWINVQSHY